MSDERRRIAELEEELRRLKAERATSSVGPVTIGNVTSAVIQIGSHNVATDGRAFAGSPTDDAATALAYYRGLRVAEARYLPLGVLDSRATDAAGGRAPWLLSSVYIDLLTTTRREPKSGMRSAQRGAAGMVAPDEQPPLAALEAVAANPRLVLLGDPGGGKSTFLSRLVLVVSPFSSDR